MKILLVEDNEKMRKMIGSVLSKSAGEIIECEDGKYALDAYRLHNPDWVLMDIEMKYMDGITATKQIMNEFPDARIVIVTNYGDADLRKSAEAAGALAFVLKDDLRNIRAVIDENMEHHT